MVVICAGTSGYSAVADLRYLWVRQKRFQGSHGTNDEQARAYNDLVRQGVIDPCVGRVVPFDQIGQVHWEMGEGRRQATPRSWLVPHARPGKAAEELMTLKPGLGCLPRPNCHSSAADSVPCWQRICRPHCGAASPEPA